MPRPRTKSPAKLGPSVAQKQPVQTDLVRFVLDSTADGIVVADEHGRFLLFNPAAEQMVGIGLTESQLDDWSERYGCFLPDGVTPCPPEDLPLARAVRGESVDNAPLFIRNARKPEGVWLSCNARPVRDTAGQLKGGLVVFRDITQQKKDEEEIRTLNAALHRHARDQETRYRLAAKATRDAIWDWDLIANRIEWNEGLEILFGYEFDQEMGTLDWWAERVHPEDRERTVRGLHTAIDGGASTWTDEYRFRCHDGSYFLVVDRGYVVRDETGHPVRVVGAMLDITERKRSEAALAHSLSLLEATLDSTADGILVVDEEGRIVSFNRKFVEMWGLPENVLVSRDDKEAIGHALKLLKDPSGFLEKVRELYASPEATSLDILELTDGRVFERYSQTRRLGGESIGRVWSFRDVTQRHRAEQSLQQEREFLKTLLDNLSEGIVACDAQGVISLFNRTTREMHGSAPVLVPPDQWPEHFGLYRSDGKTLLRAEETPLYRAFQGEHVRNAEIVVSPPSGGPQRQFLVNGNAITTPDGTKAGAVIVLHDVTERNRLQRQLQQTQKLESIGTLAGGIAHDFNNLLAVIVGNASMLLRDKTLTPRARESLKDILEASERGSSLTHQLLAYARGGLQRLGPNDLNVLVKSVLQMLRRTTPPQIEFELALAPDLPAIMADPGQIEQVIMNLWLNAIQASQPPCRIDLRTSLENVIGPVAAQMELAPGIYARLDVQDYGSGMDAATAERIFEPFFTTKFTGRGMGLAAALGIVSSHKGHIRVESAPGKGTSMSVFLPISQDQGRAHTRPSSARGNDVLGGTETVLVIDDDPAVSRTVLQILSSLGYCVIAHNDVESATAFLESNAEDVDLVILDMNVPRISSEQLFKEIRSRCKGAPILLSSGIDEPEIEGSARSWGAAGFLQKPFSMAVLGHTIRRTLDGQ